MLQYILLTTKFEHITCSIFYVGSGGAIMYEIYVP